MASTPSKGLRLDIQGLRAIAVISVIVFHAQKHWLPGGFVGVDIFFVISGFLITGLLRRELSKNRTGVLRDFFVKRLRRLFPAAAIVIITTIVVLYICGPILRFQEFAIDSMSSLLYVANLRFSLSNTGYFANDIPTPFLHLWSLSVEEQFYIGLAFLLVAMRQSSQKRVIQVISGILAASFLFSVLASTLMPDFAYFHLPTRAWEFMIGSLLSLTIPFWQRLALHWVQYFRWAGFGLIVLSLIVVRETIAFPGWIAALPTMGAALIIAAGSSTVPKPRHLKPRNDFVQRFIESKPLTYIGDISYSLYLWHWPMLIVPLVMTGKPLSVGASLLAVAASFILGSLSFHFIEQPIRIHKGAPFSVRRNVLVTATLSLLICALAGGMMISTQNKLNSVTVAASKIVTGRGLQTPIGNTDFPAPKELTPGITNPAAMTDQTQIGCMQDFTSALVKVCTFDPVANPKKTILLYGDSQMNMLWPMVKAVAQKRGWRLSMIVKAACPPADLPPYPGGPPGLAETCPRWQTDSLQKINEINPNVIMLAGHPNDLLNTMGLPRDEFDQTWAKALASYAQKLPQAATKLFVTDRPVWPAQPMQCLSQNLNNTAACNAPLTTLIDQHRIDLEVSTLEPLGIKTMSIRDAICPNGTCSLVQKNYITYLDGIHLTEPFASAIAPFAWAPLSQAMGDNP